MQQSASITEITKAIISVMKEVKGIDKSMTVGSGNASYKGVSDKDVKTAIGRAMEKNGLALIPTEVEPTLQIDRWEETGGQYGPKQKQSVFTSVKTKYLLIHESGEFIETCGYGHGVDSQDKAAGKATTYAMKCALLYMFMVPTGKIDDADATHSNDIETPQISKPKPVEKPVAKEDTSLLYTLLHSSTLEEDTDDYKKAWDAIIACKDYKTYEKLHHRLLELQPSLDQIPNPSQKDISKHMAKAIG